MVKKNVYRHRNALTKIIQNMIKVDSIRWNTSLVVKGIKNGLVVLAIVFLQIPLYDVTIICFVYFYVSRIRFKHV